MNQVPASTAEDFHHYYFRQSRWLICVGFLFLGFNYFLSDFFTAELGLPAELPSGVKWAERGVIMPVSLGTALMLAIWGDRRWMEWIVIFAGLAVGCGVVMGRRIWQLHGEDFPGDYSMFIPCGLAALTALGARVWIFAAPTMLLNLFSAYYVYGNTPSAHFETFAVGAAAFVVAAVNWQLRRAMTLMWKERQHFEGLSRTDPLTSLHNRRAFEGHAGAALSQAIRNAQPVALAMFDLDFFKPYNDRYGHLAGDRVLVATADVLSDQSRRPLDMVARVGGEEFACFWFGITADGARQRCEAVVARIRELGIAHMDSPVDEIVTVSAGVYCCTPNDSHNLSGLVREADAALYAAKSGGRNRVMFAESP